ncbi:hypothetical protein M5E86_20220 [Blautia wexlerae]|nr:hypothetical protein M5E86_20220 [Blautia wexlerae]
MKKELKGTDGCEICIVDANGNKKSVIAYEPKKMEKISILRLMAIFKVLFMNNLKKTEDVL